MKAITRLLGSAGRAFARHALVAFFILLVGLFVLIGVGQQLRAPEEYLNGNGDSPKTVRVFTGDHKLTLATSGRVEKESLIIVRAQVSGVVTRIAALSGDTIERGQTIVALSDSYTGGSLAGKDAEIAEVSLETTNITADKNIYVIDKTKDEFIPRTTDDEAKVARKQQDILRYNSLLDKEVARINAERGAIANSLYVPPAASRGTLEHVYVDLYESVTPGTPLYAISTNNQGAFLEVGVSPDVAKRIDVESSSMLVLHDERIDIAPYWLSNEATNGQEFTVLFAVPEPIVKDLVDESYVRVELSLTNTDDVIRLIPIDAVQFLQDISVVFVLESDNTVSSRAVEIGKVLSQYVEVKSGLSAEDIVVVSRNVFDGDKVITEIE